VMEEEDNERGELKLKMTKCCFLSLWNDNNATWSIHGPNNICRRSIYCIRVCVWFRRGEMSGGDEF
jgi:hypothetical protein